MKLHFTHVLSDPTDRVLDALAQDPTGLMIFVPGALPCGECSLCRRALVSLCPRMLRLGSAAELADRDLPERFLMPIEGPAGVAAIDPSTALAAGRVAGLLEVMGRIGTGPGDIAIWLGRDGGTAAGAALAANRGARSFLGGRPVDALSREAARLPEDPPGREAALAPIDAGPASVHAERKVFVHGPDLLDAGLAALALELVRPGDTLLIRETRSAPELRLPAAALALARVKFTDGYHPDFVIEALATIRRNEIDVAALLADERLTVRERS